MFISIEFKEAWDVWKKHKQEKHGIPYTPTSEDRALSILFKKSHGIEQLAIDSIDYSIEHNWAAIYIKPIENGRPETNNGNSTGNGQARGTSSDRMEALRNW